MSHPMRADPWTGHENELLSSDRVVAWRRWRLRPDESGEPQLGSAHENHIWPTATLRAECDPSRTWSYRMALSGGRQLGHQPPVAGCRCGIYAYRTPELARPIGPGVWAYGRVVVGGPIFAIDSGYRGREATINGPLEVTVECVGGDDPVSPTRCFEPPERIKYGPDAYYPVCSSHPQAPVNLAVGGSYSLAEYFAAAAGLAVRLETSIVTPVSV